MTNMAMNAAAVYGMCCGIFLSFCMKDPFAGRATCSDSSGLTFYIYLFSLFYYFLFASIIRTVSRLLFLQISIGDQSKNKDAAKNTLASGDGEEDFSPANKEVLERTDRRQSSGRKINSLPVQDCIRGKKIKLKIEAL